MAGGKWAQLPSKAAASRNGAHIGASCTRAMPKTPPSMDRKQRSGNTIPFCIRDEGETSFPLKRHLWNPLPPMRTILDYIHAYEPFVDSIVWQSKITVPAPVRVRLTCQKLRHLVPSGYGRHSKLLHLTPGWPLKLCLLSPGCSTCFQDFLPWKSLHAGYDLFPASVLYQVIE